VEDAQSRFGNTEFITGHDALRSTMAEFFSMIKAMHHDFDVLYQKDHITR
jgi:hypothetical protein